MRASEGAIVQVQGRQGLTVAEAKMRRCKGAVFRLSRPVICSLGSDDAAGCFGLSHLDILSYSPAVDREFCCGNCSPLGDSRKGTLGFLGSLTMPSDCNPSRYLAKTSPRYFTVPSS